MKLFLLAILTMVLIAIWLRSIAESKTIEIPQTLVVKLKKRLRPPKEARPLHLIAPNNTQVNATEVQEWEPLWEFRLSRYYSLEEWQEKYYTNKQADLAMNCDGDVESCKTTADWHILTDDDIGVLYSCPKSIKLGTKIKLVFHRGTTYGICKDRGWAIKDKRLDAWCGYWDEWVENIREGKWCYTGKAKVFVWS